MKQVYGRLAGLNDNVLEKCLKIWFSQKTLERNELFS